MSRIASGLIIIFATLSSVGYFIQFTVVPFNLKTNNLAGLEQFIQLNEHSFAASLCVLGWGFYFGLACFFMAPIFNGSRLKKWIRVLFIITGILCNISLLSYISNLRELALIASGLFNLTLMATCILLTLFFNKQIKNSFTY